MRGRHKPLNADLVDRKSTVIFEHLGNLGDFIGGIAVVITLIYLTSQVRQSSAAIRTASREVIYAGCRAQNSQVVRAEAVASLLAGQSSAETAFMGDDTAAAMATALV